MKTQILKIETKRKVQKYVMKVSTIFFLKKQIKTHPNQKEKKNALL
jgi:hypothetical protein